MYVDGIDYFTKDYRHPITKEFDPRNFDFKGNCAGLRYLMGTSLYTNKMCYLSAGYMPGKNTDHVISQRPGEIVDLLNNSNEMAFADAIFTNPCFITPNGTHSLEQRLLRVAQARHEMVNGMFREFGILTQRFRNKREFHPTVVHAVGNIVQLELMYERPPMDIKPAIGRYGTGV